MLGQDEGRIPDCSCGSKPTGICPIHGTYVRHTLIKTQSDINDRQDGPYMIPVPEFSGGTERSSRKPPYHLVPRELLEAVAWTRFDGDAKYAPGNWQKGDKQFFVDCLNHAIDHLYDFSWDDSEDHLGHAACNIAFILWAMARDKVNKQDFQEVAKVFKEIREERLKVIK